MALAEDSKHRKADRRLTKTHGRGCMRALSAYPIRLSNFGIVFEGFLASMTAAFAIECGFGQDSSPTTKRPELPEYFGIAGGMSQFFGRLIQRGRLESLPMGAIWWLINHRCAEQVVS